MSEPIKVGDLVMVVRGHACIVERYGGCIFTVKALIPNTAGGYQCSKCRGRDLYPEEPLGASGYHSNDSVAMPTSFLKKINPPAQDETTDQPEELTA